MSEEFYTKKEIGKIGESLAKKYFEKKGYHVNKGFGSSPDLKIYRTEPSNNRSKTSNYITCEVKCSNIDKPVHRPNDKQKEKNQILALVKLDEVKFDSIEFKIKFRVLGDCFVDEDELPLKFVEKKWDVNEVDKK